MKLTRHMCGILHVLNNNGPTKSNDLVPTALIALAMQGYVIIGALSFLSPKGKELMASGTVPYPDAELAAFD